MSNKELQSELVDKLYEKYQLKGKINSIELSEEFHNPKGVKGFDKNTFYLFNGIKVRSKEGLDYVFMRGDILKLPINKILG